MFSDFSVNFSSIFLFDVPLILTTSCSTSSQISAVLAKIWHYHSPLFRFQVSELRDLTGRLPSFPGHLPSLPGHLQLLLDVSMWSEVSELDFLKMTAHSSCDFVTYRAAPWAAKHTKYFLAAQQHYIWICHKWWWWWVKSQKNPKSTSEASDHLETPTDDGRWPGRDERQPGIDGRWPGNDGIVT